MSSFCPFLVLFQNGWGAVIVCIIYTTGYKTPLCHSPESTYRCGCIVYKHMYCNKIILRAWLPNDHFWDILRILRKLSLLWVHMVWKRRPPDFLLAQGTYSSFRSQSFESKLPSISSLHCGSSVSQVLDFADRYCLFSEYFGWIHEHPSRIIFLFIHHHLIFSLLFPNKCLAYLCM